MLCCAEGGNLRMVLSMSSFLLLKSDECRSKTIKYYADKPFTPCINLYAGHDIYFENYCPVPEPRLCIEPIPPVTKFQSKPHQKRKPLKDKTFIWPDDSTIPYANMSRIKSRVTDRTKDSIFPRDCLECWDYAPTSRYWSTFIDSIEEAAGFKFTNGPVRTVLDFGCGSGGFLGEMAVRGVTGICTAREVTNKEGNETYLPYLRTVAARGMIAMHVSITSHQPFLSNSFDFVHCSWVLAYVPATPRMYSQIFIEFDRLLTPGGLIVQQGAWFKRKGNQEMLELFAFSKFLLEEVLQWKILNWKVDEMRQLNEDKSLKTGKPVLYFIAKKPLSRVSKDWSKDPTLLRKCPSCFGDVPKRE